MSQDLIRLSAVDAVRALRRGEVRPIELIEAAATRIEAVDPVVNAVPTRCLERARQLAPARPPAAGERAATLAGLPILIKDLNEVAGVRTTYGSPIFKDHVPQASDAAVRRLEQSGGLVMGKTNTPEFGAGAQTFNEVFGTTRNPWKCSHTCGGSSGGAAVALATGMAWLAQGSDLGGSLRTPASFCSVVGLRPTRGLVPQGPGPLPFETLAVEGPMARNVADAALMLEAMAGFDPVDPLSRAAEVAGYLAAAEAPRRPLRLAVSADLGHWPVARDVRAVFAAATDLLARAGIDLVGRMPDFAAAGATFQTLRAAGFAARLGPTLAAHRDLLKADIVWNIEAGLALSADRIGAAKRAQGALFHQTMAIFEEVDFFLCPTALVPPFPAEQKHVEQVDGHRFDNYVDWLGITFAWTLTGCPVLALPAGFTDDGLPVGVQLVGRPFGEARLLSAGAALEEIFADSGTPIDPRP